MWKSYGEKLQKGARLRGPWGGRGHCRAENSQREGAITITKNLSWARHCRSALHTIPLTLTTAYAMDALFFSPSFSNEKMEARRKLPNVTWLENGSRQLTPDSTLIPLPCASRWGSQSWLHIYKVLFQKNQGQSPAPETDYICVGWGWDMFQIWSQVENHRSWCHEPLLWGKAVTGKSGGLGKDRC